jgi:hypothetical protein
MGEAKLERTQLSGANLSNALLTGVHAERSDLSNANFTGAVLDHASFESATLTEVSFLNTRLTHADFSAATMPYARIVHCDLSFTAFPESELWSAQLLDSAYPSADIRGTNLERTGVYRHQALNRYPDLRYSDSTRWDHPERRRILIASPKVNPRRNKGPSTPIKQVAVLTGLRETLASPVHVETVKDGLFKRIKDKLRNRG